MFFYETERAPTRDEEVGTNLLTFITSKKGEGGKEL